MGWDSIRTRPRWRSLMRSIPLRCATGPPRLRSRQRRFRAQRRAPWAIGGRRSAQLGNADDVRKDLAAIERIHQRLVDTKKKDFAEAAESDLKEAQAWLAFAEGKYDDAVEALRPIADKEDATGDEPEGIPAREMIADILLEAKRPQQALAEYQTDLKLHPNRFDALYGAARAAEAAGKQNDATEYYALLLKICDGSNSTRPELSRARQLVAQK